MEWNSTEAMYWLKRNQNSARVSQEISVTLDSFQLRFTEYAEGL